MKITTKAFPKIASDWIEELTDPDMVRAVPDLLGRVAGDLPNMVGVRSETKKGVEASVSFEGGASGVASATVFDSTDGLDRGGLVLRLAVENDGSALAPFAVVTESGVDLHLPGDEESRSLLIALQQVAIKSLLSRSTQASR